MSIRGQATYCLPRWLSRVAKAWEKEGRGEKARLVPEKFALHSGEFEGAPRLAGTELIIQCIYGVRGGKDREPSVGVSISVIGCD